MSPHFTPCGCLGPQVCETTFQFSSETPQEFESASCKPLLPEPRLGGSLYMVLTLGVVAVRVAALAGQGVTALCRGLLRRSRVSLWPLLVPFPQGLGTALEERGPGAGYPV